MVMILIFLLRWCRFVYIVCFCSVWRVMRMMRRLWWCCFLILILSVEFDLLVDGVNGIG